MPAIARAEASTTISYVPTVRDRGRDVHALRIASATASTNPRSVPTQRSLPLFRVMPSRNPATRVDPDSHRIDAQQASLREQPVASAPPRNACVVVIPAPPSSSRRQLWSAAGVASLCADYPTAKPVREISAELGRSVSAVYGKARRLNLKRPRRGAALGEAAVALPVPALVPDALQPKAAAAPWRLPEHPAPKPALRIPQLTLSVSNSPPAPKAERTKMGGRPGRWTENDGALSERLERLFISNFAPSCIAAVLGVTAGSVETRAWVVNCPRRDPQTLRHDVEAARLVDRLAAPLPGSVYSWKTGKMLVRKRCTRKGHFIWGASGTTLSNDAKRQRSYKILLASAPMHAW